MEKEFELKRKLISEQKGMDAEIVGAKGSTQLAKEKYKEDRKDKRTAKQASQQSKLIQQRKQDLDPIDFDGQDLLSSDYKGVTGM